jgi:hypothetical protein
VVDTAAPKVTLRSLPAVTLAATQVHWSATDSGAGVGSYDVRYRRAGRNGRFGAWTYPSAWQHLRTTSMTRTESRGYTYCFAVRAHDVAGNVSEWTALTCTTRPLDDRALAASRSWSRRTGSRFYMGTVTTASRAGAWLATGKVGARRIALIATKCSTCGSVRVYLAGRLVGMVPLHASRITHGAVVWLPAFARHTGTLTIQVATSGSLIQIDGVAALP